MAERNLAYTPEVAGDVIEYKPLSPLAVVGLGVAILYAAILLATAGTALFKGEPFFLGSWMTSLPILGAVLSGLGWWHIWSSEGTRAGAALAKWGLGISAVAGLGYLTYQTFTGLAILQQANRFVMERDEQSGLFPRLRGSEVDVRSAFLFTLDVADRGARPESAQDMQALDMALPDNPKGRLTLFLDHPLTKLFRLLATQGDSTTITPLGVHTWTYENHAYHISRGYRITTEEGVFEVPISVSSIEPSAAGEGRKWKFNLQRMEQLSPVSRTELGIKRQRMRLTAMEFLSDPKTGWFSNLLRGRSFEVYLGTLPAAMRHDVKQRAAVMARTPLTALVGAPMTTFTLEEDDATLKKLLPGYRPLNMVSEYFNMNRLRTWNGDAKAAAVVKDAILNSLKPEKLPWLSIKVIPNDLAPVETKDGELVTICPSLFVVKVPVQKGFVAEVLVLLDVTLAAPANFDPAAVDASQLWRVKSVEVSRAWLIPQEKS